MNKIELYNIDIHLVLFELNSLLDYNLIIRLLLKRYYYYSIESQFINSNVLIDFNILEKLIKIFYRRNTLLSFIKTLFLSSMTLWYILLVALSA